VEPNQNAGLIDLIFQVPGRLVVTQWKFYRINYLQVGAGGNTPQAGADILRDYKLPEILQLKFVSSDQFHKGTVKSQVEKTDGPQLGDYVKSAYVQQLMGDQSLELRAHLVIIVGSRHILLWDMDKEGKLAAEPRLVEGPSRLDRQDG